MRAWVVLVVVALAGCPKKDVAIYRSLSAPGAMQTCDANKVYRAQAKGADASEAKALAEAQIRSTITANKGCGALIFNEGSGKALDGTTNHVADFQWCKCR